MGSLTSYTMKKIVDDIRLANIEGVHVHHVGLLVLSEAAANVEDFDAAEVVFGRVLPKNMSRGHSRSPYAATALRDSIFSHCSPISSHEGTSSGARR